MHPRCRVWQWFSPNEGALGNCGRAGFADQDVSNRNPTSSARRTVALGFRLISSWPALAFFNLEALRSAKSGDVVDYGVELSTAVME